MLDNYQLHRTIFIAKKTRSLLEEKDITLQEIADKLGVSHAYISQNLGGKKVPSDTFFKKVFKIIPLSDEKIEDIFMEADMEEFKYKYGEEMFEKYSSEELSEQDILLDLKKERGLTDEQFAMLKIFLDGLEK